MPSEYTKLLELSQYQKSDEAPSIIYAHLESLIEKMDGCENNPEIPSTTKVSEHIPLGFSMSTISSFKDIGNNHDVYSGKDCVKTFCEQAMKVKKIIHFKMKRIKLFTNEQQESYENAKICYIYKKKFEDKNVQDKKYCKVKDHCPYNGEYKGAAQSICNLKHSRSG